jgi:hypothetical protein
MSEPINARECQPAWLRPISALAAKLVAAWRRLLGLRTTEGLATVQAPSAIDAEPDSPAPAPALHIEPKATRAARRPASGVPSLRSVVLNDLDRYFHYIRRLRRADPEAYGAYAKLGASLCVAGGVDDGLDPFFLRTLPAFGAVAPVFTGDDDTIGAKFIYFTKYKRPPVRVEAAPHARAVYLLSVYHDDQKIRLLDKRGFGVLWEIPIAIESDGTIRPLRTLNMERQTIRHRSRTGETSTIQHARWGLPDGLKIWAEERGRSPAEHVRMLFVLAANMYVREASGMIRIEAEKGDLTAVFSIDPLTTPAFFRDRDGVRTTNGRRAAIFHVVRTHMRRLPDGRTIPIRMHFAGLRTFRWNGYTVSITVPGKDHASLIELDTAAIDEEAEAAIGKLSNDAVPFPELAMWVAKHIRSRAWQSSKRDRRMQTEAMQQ